MIKNTVPYIVHTCETNKIQYSNNIYSKQFLFIISSNNEVSILNRCWCALQWQIIITGWFNATSWQIVERLCIHRFDYCSDKQRFVVCRYSVHRCNWWIINCTYIFLMWRFITTRRIISTYWQIINRCHDNHHDHCSDKQWFVVCCYRVLCRCKWQFAICTYISQCWRIVAAGRIITDSRQIIERTGGDQTNHRGTVDGTANKSSTAPLNNYSHYQSNSSGDEKTLYNKKNPESRIYFKKINTIIQNFLRQFIMFIQKM